MLRVWMNSACWSDKALSTAASRILSANSVDANSFCNLRCVAVKKSDMLNLKNDGD